MDYQTFGPMVKPTQKQRTSYRNNFAEHNYNYVDGPQTTKSSSTNTQNHLFSQSQNLHHPSTNSVNFNEYPQNSHDRTILRNFKIKIINDFIKIRHLVLTT